MALLSSWPRGRKAIASAVTIAVIAGVPIGFAILHDGFPVSDVDLTQRDVWVTNGQDLLAGRLNRQIEELDAAVASASRSLDVLQNGTSVFMVDSQLGTLERIDPAFTTLVERVTIPQTAEVTFGGTTLAIVSPEGDLWVVDVTNQLSFDASSDPTLKLAKGGHAAVSPDGVVFASSPADQKLYEIDAPGDTPSSRSFPVSTDHQLATVGDQPVALDLKNNSLITPNGSAVPLPDKGMRLQQSGEANSFAVVASATGLLEVPLAGGAVTTVDAKLTTAVTRADGVSAPVWLDGCAHGAWADAQQYLLSCGDKSDVQKIEGQSVGSVVEFRVNKHVIALNNLTNGNVWLVDNNMRLVQNWDEVTPPQEDETEDGDQKATTQSFQDTLAERTDQNRTPIARDDDFGVRPGRTTVLPVIENDTDPDGDVLTVTNFSDVPSEVGQLDSIDGGRALQFTPASGATAPSFRYTVDDGRPNGVAEANVSIRVVPLDQNNPPVEKRTAAVSIEAGGTVKYNVLTDWIDPDGDDLVLQAASATSGDDVRFTPDGWVTFQHQTGELGQKEVPFVVSDGKLSASGTLVVDVKPAGTLTPVGTPDFGEVFVNETVTIAPLDNDSSPSTDGLKLLGVDELPLNAQVIPNLDSGKVTFSADRAGVYYFKYSVGAGAETSVGLVRVDVKPDPDAPLPPIAVKDTAFLRPGEPSIVTVLANDVSPNGLVLAVQSVDTSSTNGQLSVEVLNNTVIRITTSAALTEQTQFTYTISDGTQTALAGVTVIPVAPIVNRQPPIAVDDPTTVRAGDIVSVPVLDNDDHPDQARLILNPELVDTTDDGGGLAFVNGDTVRYQAPTKAGSYSVIYRVGDQYGESATARVLFTVTAPDLKSNLPPNPTPQTARTFAGSTVRIDIPLDRIDPDGDSVIVVGPSQAPTLGAITDQGPTWFEYTAGASASGTDSFRYEVQDTYGARAFGLINIGVIPRAATSEPPNAVDDSIEMKPGRTASVPVLLNDSDPNGYPLHVSKELPEVDEGITAVVKDNKVIVSAPKVEGSFTIRYQIDNGNGGIDTAFLQVKVTEDAKAVYPTAEDYYVPTTDVVKHSTVPVQLKGLIGNPSGLDSELKITLEGPNVSHATVDQATQTITVTPGKTRIAIAYRVTNEIDKLSATAFIVVPPAVSASYSPPPYIKKELVLNPPVIKMNGSGQWDLADIVTVPSGRPAIITDPSTVSATNAKNSDLYVDNHTIKFAPAPDYRGQASITFEVTDGKSADDPNGNTALLTLVVTVGDKDFQDVPPIFVTQNVTIEAGEDPTTVDLRASTSHPNLALRSQFSYDGLSGQNSDIDANISGGSLQISSPFGVQPGTKTVLSFNVKYGEFTVPGTVTVTTVSSTRPLPQAVEDDVKGKRGVSDTFNVLANDYNPFAAQGKNLKVIDAYVQNGADTSATVSFTADGNISVHPDASFIGNIAIVYTVEDVTKDPARHVQGSFIYTVRDRPSAVLKPTFSENDGSVTVQWETPDTNGEPIDQYDIKMGGVTKTVPGSQAQYVWAGLTNGQPYQFTVSAHNIMGMGDASPQSDIARPYGAPSAPTSVTATPSTDGSGNVSMSWSGADGNGRDISSFTWTVSPGGASGTVNVSGGVTGASATFTGNVGSAYTFTVTSAGPRGPSQSSSASSNSATPTPGVVASLVTSVGARGDHTVTMTWGDAAAQGATVTGFHLLVPNVFEGDIPASQHSYTFQGTFGTSYNFSIAAQAGATTGPGASSNSATPLDVLPPPVPHATIAKGGGASVQGCSDSSVCHYVVVYYENFPSGSYATVTQRNGSNITSTHTYNMSGTNGVVTSNVLGIMQAGETIQVQMSGAPGTYYTDPISGAQWNSY
ncbi:MAG: Ig-like domain-containing protein [Rhodoglobus sp.]